MEITNRGSFVRNEYRYEIREDLPLQGLEPSAREIIVETNLGEAAAQALATKILADAGRVTQGFEIGIEGVIDLNDFAGHPPLFRVALPGYDVADRVFRVIEARVTRLAGRTTLVVRG
ncbi:hypothetical protein GS397_10295 [Sphingobium yanoikuyae]|uniref:Uncharacterized protein n=1 Tax=Sphingobium yanoikuyae TaxID=13690 RepID=A0A6P1GH15_SPHYA|nr:hypothetical protein [Sphingobium yanoikuyae]QHD67402.1 hypothetical protein GS397_10295 [Sphingobium yanoikuyae]RSU74055.1 hypothetical protein BRX37_14170 [Sphingomonas sp. S-NIH.Pt3_0716]